MKYQNFMFIFLISVNFFLLNFDLFGADSLAKRNSTCGAGAGSGLSDEATTTNSDDSKILLRDLFDKKQVLDPHMTGGIYNWIWSGVDEILFSPDGSKIAGIVSNADKVVTWDLSLSEDVRDVKIKSIKFRKDDVVGVSPDGNILVINDYDYGFRLRTSNDKESKILADIEVDQKLASVVFGKGNDSFFGVSDTERFIKLYSVDTLNVLRKFKFCSEVRLKPLHMVFNPEKDRLILVFKDESSFPREVFKGPRDVANIFDIGEDTYSAKSVSTPGFYYDEHIEKACVSSDNTTIAACVGHDGNIVLIDLVTGNRICKTRSELNVHSLKFSPDGRKLAIGSTHGKMVVYEADNLRLKALERAANLFDEDPD